MIHNLQFTIRDALALIEYFHHITTHCIIAPSPTLTPAAMPLGQQLISTLAPIKELVAGFAITGYIFYSIPISGASCMPRVITCSHSRFHTLAPCRRGQGQVKFVLMRTIDARCHMYAQSTSTRRHTTGATTTRPLLCRCRMLARVVSSFAATSHHIK